MHQQGRGLFPGVEEVDFLYQLPGVTCLKDEIILGTDACDVGEGGTLYQWQELNPAEFPHCQFQTSGLNRDGSLKHDYPANEWRLVPLGHSNWEW